MSAVLDPAAGMFLDGWREAGGTPASHGTIPWGREALAFVSARLRSALQV
jgi:hypothetical protein